MTKALKCIGGIWNGRNVALDDGCTQLIVRESSELPSILDRNAPITMEFREELYVIDSVRCGDDQILFLRPENWSSYRALRKALEP